MKCKMIITIEDRFYLLHGKGIGKEVVLVSWYLHYIRGIPCFERKDES